MLRKCCLSLLVIMLTSFMLPIQSYACDVSTIEKPESHQTLYFEPVEIIVQFEEGANPDTFKAWLNFSNNITDLFEPIENGMKALVGPEDGLRIKKSGRLFGGTNFLVTSIKNQTNEPDIDLRIFFSREDGDDDTVIFTILQTSDLHHHASGYGPFLDYTPLDTTDNDCVLGGYSRLATLIGQIRAEQAEKDVPVMLFDSGDFLMGTTYDLTATNPIGFQFFNLMDYDAITLGNHEFDWSQAGLAMLLQNSIVEGGFDVPIVATNTLIPADAELNYFRSTGNIVDKKSIELSNGLKVGILGLMGEDADDKSPVAPPVTFNHDYSFIQQYVDNLKNNDEAQFVIALSHTGVHNDGSGEDSDLASSVNGINIIASGHAHTATSSAFDVNGTLIFSPGSYGEALSRMDVAYNIAEGRVVDSKFTLIPVDDTIPGDPMIQGMVEQYHLAINESLAPLGVALDTPVAATGFDLELASFQVTGLGSLCADSVRNVSNAVAPFNFADPVDIGIVASGVIRDPIYMGNTGAITFSDVYNCLPLGISPYEQSPPGYPIMHAYLNGLEVYTMCEVGLSLSRMIGSDYYLNFSGIKIDYNLNDAATFSGVKAVYLYEPSDLFCTGSAVPINPYDPDTLYHITVDLYALQMLNVVTGYGFPITPKDAAGNPIDPADYASFRVDADPSPGVQELKEWMTPLNYLPGLGSVPSAIYGPGGAVMGRVNYVN